MNFVKCLVNITLRAQNLVKSKNEQVKVFSLNYGKQRGKSMKLRYCPRNGNNLMFTNKFKSDTLYLPNSHLA